MSIIEHMEDHLGPIDSGWREGSGDIQVLLFRDRPVECVSTFLSLGMSRVAITLSEEKEVRQELLICIYSVGIVSMIVSFLLSMCEAIVGRGKAVLRGEVIQLSQELASRIGFESVYCAIPVCFDETFATYLGTDPPTVLVWLLPIYKSESDYVGDNGWERFEDLLEAKNPDLFSLNRHPVV